MSSLQLLFLWLGLGTKTTGLGLKWLNTPVLLSTNMAGDAPLPVKLIWYLSP